jgi:thiamine-phosphate pyrophosphorylase
VNTFRIIAISNRKLCPPDEAAFLRRLEETAAAVDAVILREKDLSAGEYLALAEKAMPLCLRRGAEFIPHAFTSAARALGCGKVLLPWDIFRKTGVPPRLTAGVSVHSSEEAALAVESGAAWLLAGNVFETPCKAGLPGRGADFLAEVCTKASVPVYAVGGITPENIAAVAAVGAAGACLMSAFMTGGEPAERARALRDALKAAGVFTRRESEGRI